MNIFNENVIVDWMSRYIMSVNVVYYSPSTRFLSPGVIIERHKRDLRTRNKPKHHSMCHYEGHVKGDEASKVSLSSCNGIVSLS